MSKSISSLLISGLELSIHLGFPDKERRQLQVIVLDIEIYFSTPPKACVSDCLDDTICYASLIKEIQNKISGKRFHLIEYLTHQIYQIIKPRLPKQAKVNVCITKKPVIAGFSGTTRFNYMDA